MIKRALSDNGCPASILNELMENAHERRWPPGLSTLETRQINRNHYINFVCKRVPNKQAVLVILYFTLFVNLQLNRLVDCKRCTNKRCLKEYHFYFLFKNMTDSNKSAVSIRRAQHVFLTRFRPKEHVTLT